MYCKHCGKGVPGDSNFCPFCGGTFAQGTADTPSIADPPLAVGDESTGKNTCPLCMSRDTVQRLSTVLDMGKSSSVGAGLGGSSGPGIGGGVFATSTSSDLVRRLSPPSRPVNSLVGPWIIWCLGLYIIFSVVGGIAMGNIGSGIVLWAFLMPVIMLLAILPAQISKALRAPKFVRLQDSWDARTEQLRASYFCIRDDVIFNETAAESPDVFKANLYLI